MTLAKQQRGRADGASSHVVPDMCLVCSYRTNRMVKAALSLSGLALTGFAIGLNASGCFELTWQWVAVINGLYTAMLIAHGMIQPKNGIPIISITPPSEDKHE